MRYDIFAVCEVCGKMYKDHGMLRCSPASDLELHRIRMARETGKVKNPSWWKRSELPRKAVMDFAQRFPASVRAMFTRQSDPFLDWKLPDVCENTRQYVAEFCELNHLT